MWEAFVAIAGPLAVTVAMLVEIVRRAVDPESARVPKVVWPVLSLALGVALALVWEINAMAEFGDTTQAQGTLGQVLTGLAIGGFASAGWHEVKGLLSTKKAEISSRSTTDMKARVK